MLPPPDDGLGKGAAMHGMVFAELKKFVVAGLGAEAWNRLTEAAGMPGKVFLPSQTYSDADLVRLVSAASEITGRPASELVEAFGTFIVPGLVRAFGAHINPSWRTLDLLENTEETIHRVVRISTPGATPPALAVHRASAGRVTIEYASPRRLCALARGIVKGVAQHYGESVTIEEAECMLTGAPRCRIDVAIA
jgi:hypothetical protein